MNKQERREKFEGIKPYIKFGITGLVELFTQAVSKSVMSHVDGGKLANFGAKIGASLVGLVVGDQVSEYVCNGIMDFADDLEEIKEAIDEAKEDE